MNKFRENKLMCVMLALILVLSFALAAVTFADDSVDKKEVAALEKQAEEAIAELAVAEPAPLTTPISISIEEALKNMENSVQMQMINIQAMSDKAVAAGATEGLNKIEEAKDALKEMKNAAIASGDEALMEAYRTASFSADFSSKKQVELLKKYAKSMLAPNDTARKSELNLNSLEMYYNLKNMEARAKIAADNYDITKTIYDKTKLKFDKGTVSKMDLLTAESDLNKAKDTKLAAEDGLVQMQMGFNMFFGYDLNQKVTLKSELNETALSAIKLEDGIKSALENRNEIKAAAYQFELAKMNYGTYRAYPSSSSKHLGAEAQYLAVKANYDTINSQIEMDVRTKYMAMNEAYEALKTAKTTESNAIETARLAQLQYDAGYCTLTMVQQAQLGSYSAQIAKAQALLDLKLAVEEYELSTKYGVAAAALN